MLLFLLASTSIITGFEGMAAGGCFAVVGCGAGCVGSFDGVFGVVVDGGVLCWGGAACFGGAVCFCASWFFSVIVFSSSSDACLLPGSTFSTY